ncbi:hypothetical protein GGR56DRAFT_544292 [Xylariaceae sp. FL0804]|nr:hypothetical protein GGR56DRAFT_544292 [Xylariaceae sp. FL0804]
MAQDGGTHLTGICFLASFLLLSHSSQRHSLIDQPKLSSCLLLFVSGALSFAGSVFSKWLPGADGRFDSDAGLKGSYSSLPQRPRRFYIPCIIILIVIRLEIAHNVVRNFQCASKGVEAFLPLALALFKFLSHRTVYVESDEPEDMWGSPLEDFKMWLMGSPLISFFGIALFSYGVFLAGDSTIRSTYFCSNVVDQQSFIVFLQITGVLIDMAILVMAWRVLCWARTTRTRLRTLGGILLAASMVASLKWTVSWFLQPRGVAGLESFRGTTPLYVFDIVSTGLVVSAFVVSITLLMCESSPLEPTATATLFTGLFTGIQDVLHGGTYQQVSASQPLVVLSIISTGFTVFMYANDMRSIVFIHRFIIVLLFLCIIGASTTFTVVKSRSSERHPIDELVYKNRIEADRWLRHATVSTTLKVATAEYKERHHGRDPPQGFDKWFDFAQQRLSVIIDRYDQIEEDLLPFWGLDQRKIRAGLDFLAGQPNIGIITIANGKAHHNEPVDPSQKAVLDDVVSMISMFAEHLPRMEFAINLEERPKVLVPWDDIDPLRIAGSKSIFQFMSGRLNSREDFFTSNTARDALMNEAEKGPRPDVPPRKLRQLQALTCPPGSSTRGGLHWNVRDLCSSCVLPHSQQQFLADWQMSLDSCHQPDIFSLHDFHTTPHRSELYQSLLPLFSRSKTTSFSDILIPLAWPGTEPQFDTVSFSQKRDEVFWQGDVKDLPDLTDQSLHGSHQLRLMHLANNASAVDEMPMLLGIGSGQNMRFRYEATKTRDANAVLPLRISLVDAAGTCDRPDCQLLQHEFGFREPAKALDSRYVMLLDSTDGPSADVLGALRSNSVPLLSSIFQEWYTERLMPWVHFVPIDLRFHGLHSTVSYFVGLRERGVLNGREQLTAGRKDDAKWIAEEGRKWASRAIRREDMEVYMFRLLLEWGRVIDDDRDNLGFVFKE